MTMLFDPEREYTKKDVIEITGLTRNTVYETLAACGLLTSRRTYRGSELMERFVPARGMLDGGATRKEVQQAFRLKRATTPSSDDVYQQDERSQDSNFAEAISDEVAESIRAIVVAGVQDLVPYIPQMAALALEEMAQTGAIQEAFARYRNAYLSTRSSIHHPTPALFATINDVSETAEDFETAGMEEFIATDDNEALDDAWLSSDQ